MFSCEKEINEILNQWHLDATNANFEPYFYHFHKDAIYIGTDSSEHWNIQEYKAFSRPFFKRGKAWDFKTLERNIFFTNNNKVCWFDELLETWMGPCRGSGVLVYEKDKWLIKHYHLSVTVPNNKIKTFISLMENNSD